MDQNEQKIKRISTQNLKRMVPHVCEGLLFICFCFFLLYLYVPLFVGEVIDEQYEGTIIWDYLSTPPHNSVFLWTLLQNEFTSTPCHNIPNLTENTVYNLRLNSSRHFSKSQTFLMDIRDKEVKIPFLLC